MADGQLMVLELESEETRKGWGILSEEAGGWGKTLKMADDDMDEEEFFDDEDDDFDDDLDDDLEEDLDDDLDDDFDDDVDDDFDLDDEDED